MFDAGAKTIKMFYFARLWYITWKSVSTWQFPVNKVIKFGPRWEATPTCLWDSRIDSWRYRISWENGGRNTKTPALTAVAPFPFPLFRAFLPPPPLPFLRLPRRLDRFAMHQKRLYDNLFMDTKRKVHQLGTQRKNLKRGPVKNSRSDLFWSRRNYDASKN